MAAVMMRTCHSSSFLVAVVLCGVAFRASFAFWVTTTLTIPSITAKKQPLCQQPSTSPIPRRTVRCKTSMRRRTPPLTQSVRQELHSWPLHELCNKDHSVEEETSTTTSSSSGCWTREQLESYALQQGVVVSLTTLGPGYRAVARSRHDPTQILGYVEGFVRPTGALLHLDQMQVFRPVVQRARRENPQQFRGGGTVLGVGLLIAYICVLHGQERGCEVAEFLAIDDQEFQHKRLVRFYRQAGFDFVKYVGDDFKDIPDRMVWGGCGTLLRQDIPVLLESWSRLMEKSLEKDAKR